jgi:hypothetical protein
MEQLRTRARYMRPLHPTLLRFSHNQLERERVTKLMKEYKQEFGRRTIKTAMLGFFARGTAETYNIKTRFFGDRYQPKTRKIQYPLQIQ